MGALPAGGDPSRRGSRPAHSAAWGRLGRSSSWCKRVIKKPSSAGAPCPRGTALLLPLLSASCTTVEPPPFHGRDEAALRACTEAWFATAVELTAVVDGEAIPDLDRYRVQSDLFTVALPAGNILGVEPTVTQGVADGYWLLLAPLPVGEHELRFGGGIANSGISTEVTYHLTVAEPIEVAPAEGTLEATPTA